MVCTCISTFSACASVIRTSHYLLPPPIDLLSPSFRDCCQMTLMWLFFWSGWNKNKLQCLHCIHQFIFPLNITIKQKTYNLNFVICIKACLCLSTHACANTQRTLKEYLIMFVDISNHSYMISAVVQTLSAFPESCNKHQLCTCPLYFFMWQNCTCHFMIIWASDLTCTPGSALYVSVCRCALHVQYWMSSSERDFWV